VKLGQQQLSNNNTNINMFNASTQKTSDIVGGSRTEGGSAETKMNTPDKPKKHNAGEHL